MKTASTERVGRREYPEPGRDFTYGNYNRTCPSRIEVQPQKALHFNLKLNFGTNYIFWVNGGLTSSQLLVGSFQDDLRCPLKKQKLH